MTNNAPGTFEVPDSYQVCQISLRFSRGRYPLSVLVRLTLCPPSPLRILSLTTTTVPSAEELGGRVSC